MSGLGLTFLRRGNLAHPTAGSDYIKFADAEVERVCIENWSSDGVGVTIDDAAGVTNLGKVFNGNKTIKSFNELRFFTGLTTIAGGGMATGAFYQCTALEEITIPRNVIEIKDYAFSDATSLRNVSFECAPVLQKVGKYGFNNAPIEGVVYFPSLAVLDTASFNGSRFVEVNNLGNITEMKAGGYYGGVFNNNTALEKIVIPASVVTMAAYTLYGCKALRTIICQAVTPPTLAGGFMGGVQVANVTIYVPDTSIDAYKAAANWSTHAARIKGISEYQG